MCDCISKVNKQLADYNGMVEFNMLSNPIRACLSVLKINPRGKKPPHFEATFCPVCGERYQENINSLAVAAS